MLYYIIVVKCHVIYIVSSWVLTPALEVECSGGLIVDHYCLQVVGLGGFARLGYTLGMAAQYVELFMEMRSNMVKRTWTVLLFYCMPSPDQTASFA